MECFVRGPCFGGVVLDKCGHFGRKILLRQTDGGEIWVLSLLSVPGTYLHRPRHLGSIAERCLASSYLSINPYLSGMHVRTCNGSGGNTFRGNFTLSLVFSFLFFPLPEALGGIVTKLCRLFASLVNWVSLNYHDWSPWTTASKPGRNMQCHLGSWGTKLVRYRTVL